MCKLHNSAVMTQDPQGRMVKFLNIVAMNCFMCLLCIAVLTDCFPTNSKTKFDSRTPTFTIKDAINHLQKYGYLEKPISKKSNSFLDNSASSYNQIKVVTAVKRYQQFMGLQVSGVIDASTIKVMNKSRCGIKDINSGIKFNIILTSRGKRKKNGLYNRTGGRVTFWYLINPLPRTGIFETIYHQLEYAFNMWAGVTNLVFIRGDNTKYSDIEIGFYSGAHGDGEDFDYQGGIHGHASSVLKAIHFDQDEDWQSLKKGDQFRWLHPNNGSDFIQSAMHEIGHVLGLSHSSDVRSAMHPILQTFSYQTEYSLSGIDISKVQETYGMCEPQKFDSIFTDVWKDSRTYIIVGPYIYQFDDRNTRVEQSWPRSITSKYQKSAVVPDDIFWGSGFFMYWFVGDEYYAYTTRNKYPIGKYKIGTGSNGVVGWKGLQENKVDAAITIRNGNVHTSYIFRRDLVYKFIEDISDRLQVPWLQLESGWPKKISEVFPGIPNDLDTAFQWGFDGRVYFFKGRNFHIWHPGNKTETEVQYGLYQWQNVCDVYKCMIGPIKNYYDCESWSSKIS